MKDSEISLMQILLIIQIFRPNCQQKIHVCRERESSVTFFSCYTTDSFYTSVRQQWPCNSFTVSIEPIVAYVSDYQTFLLIRKNYTKHLYQTFMLTPFKVCSKFLDNFVSNVFQFHRPTSPLILKKVLVILFFFFWKVQNTSDCYILGRCAFKVIKGVVAISPLLISYTSLSSCFRFDYSLVSFRLVWIWTCLCDKAAKYGMNSLVM